MDVTAPPGARYRSGGADLAPRDPRERGVKDVSSDLLTAICDALELELIEVLERSGRRLRATLSSRAGRGSRTYALAA